ncbi:hypothetical protein QBC44DRAFT_332843 [Cladorrhinum sp. PSN332]|nr:hypothetical protein QBC44DRAFT_332843 [Cladorrhinum sp. PSN332]
MRHSRAIAISCLSVLAAGMGNEGQQQQQKSLGRTTSATAGEGGLFMSCEETYGEDWAVCGDANSSRFCFNPVMGQSCCAVDNGFCEEGTWCAPVAGYCCLDSEDLETCASNAGFELPADLLKADVPRTKQSRTAQITAPIPGNVHSSLKRSERPGDEESPQHAVVDRVYVRESAAAERERWTLTWMGLGIGAVGLVMHSC